MATHQDPPLGGPVSPKGPNWLLYSGIQTWTHQLHAYYSTACLHGSHAYCASDVGLIGKKKPNTCKFCDAPCICPCHTVE